MKTTIRFILICAIAMSYFEGSAQTNLPEDGRLTIRISGLNNNNGHVLVAVGDKHMQSMKSQAMKSDVDGVVCEFDGLPVGEQTIYVFHDENDNKAIDMTSEGNPAEGYAVAEGAGMEAYQVPVKVSSEVQQVSLKMVYLIDVIKK